MNGAELALLAVGVAFLGAFWAGAAMVVVLVVRLILAALRELGG